VILSLAAPPLVGIVCGLVCESGHHHPVEAAHHHQGGDHQHGTGMPAPAHLVGGHVCDHGLGVIDVYGPSNPPRASLLSMAASLTAMPALLAQEPATAPWNQPLERVLGPPTRSPVLRI
jgi:hypothetical protein